jgi:hypothetical protein
VRKEKRDANKERREGRKREEEGAVGRCRQV